MRNLDYLKLYLVTDSGLSLGRPIDKVVERAVAGGVTVVQLREKTASTREFYKLAVRLKDILRGTGVPLIINDRLDIALACDAEGLHIGQSDMPYSVARKILGPEKIIGLSTDTFSELEEANAWDVDYVAVLAYDTQTKADAPRPLGPEGMRKPRSLTRHPLVAIGGIHLSNAADISAAGADSVAVVSEIMSAKDPEKASADLMAAINSAIARRGKVLHE